MVAGGSNEAERNIAAGRKGERKMRKIIKGILYDTEKAEAIATGNTNMWGAIKLESTLYKGKNGHYFFLRPNIPAMAFAEKGQKVPEEIAHYIEPTTEEKAKEWVGDAMGLESYIRLFGEPEEA